MVSPFVLSKQTESQMTDFTQLFFGQALTEDYGQTVRRCAAAIKVRFVLPRPRVFPKNNAVASLGCSRLPHWLFPRSSLSDPLSLGNDLIVSAVSAPLDWQYFEACCVCEKVSRTIWRFAWQMMDLLGATKLSNRAAETGVGRMM
ncbi:hypothetical protein BTE77_35085 [Ensifer adhaerens]|nr:hypothetical protein BTE77_35085 [Ensifer adhaerens]